MKFLHPRRFIRHSSNLFNKNLFLLKCSIHHIKCSVGKDSVITHCSVESKKTGEIFIGERCNIKNTNFKFFGTDGQIIINNHVRINARPEANTNLCVKDGTSILISDDCLLSNSIDISTTDWHHVINETGSVINPNKSIRIGQHVWIGRRVTILKGVSINDNSIIGVDSVVTKPIIESNVIIAGNPAVIRKEHVNWK